MSQIGNSAAGRRRSGRSDPAWLGAIADRGRAARDHLIRRFRLLPAGTPDGIGDDVESLRSGRGAEVLVYFPDTVEALYQLEQWYAALRALHRRHRVAVVVRDSRVAVRVRGAAGLPVLAIGKDAMLNELLRRSEVKLALYVNHSVGNFQLLRFPTLVHVSLLHGDSDKTIVVSNQTKAYDFAFVAGRAAVDRAAAHLSLFDTARLIPVGRAAMDADHLERVAAGAPDAGGPPTPGRPTVLYAPTWEGAQPTAFYGSVLSHGEAIVRSLLDAGLRVIYRPHPLTGVRLPAYGQGDAAIRSLVTEAVSADPTAGHRIDVDTPLHDSFDVAHLLICDISAVAIDWLPSGRPLVITVPDSPQVVVAGTALERTVPRLSAAMARQAGEFAHREIRGDPRRDERLALVHYYVADTTPGAALAAFLAAIDDLLRRRDAEWARITAGDPTT